jgi:hypothetical protein
MMRFFLFALLLANVVMLLVLQSFRPSGMEPERLALQQHAERVSVQARDKAAVPTAAPATTEASASAASSAPPTPTPSSAETSVLASAAAPASKAPAASTVPAAQVAKAPAAAPASASPPVSPVPAPKRAPGKCVEVGDFNAQVAGKFESALPQLALPVLPVKRVVQPSPSQIVMLPPQASEAAANRRVAQLREQGFKDVSVIRDGSVRRWGISLGVFSKPELADAQLAALKQAGVSDARIEEHPLNASRLAYQLVGLDQAGSDALKALLSGFAGAALRDCP